MPEGVARPRLDDILKREREPDCDQGGVSL
jgi:hypothetical protein